MSRDKDIKKSNFVEIDSLLSSDHFDIVRNGQNLKVLASVLSTFFGVSGPLETRGEATAMPVLYVTGGVNYIRNLVAGDGIRIDFSPQDGLEINHNIQVDKVGTPLLINELTNSPILRSLVAGNGINVAVVDDTIQIALSTTPGSTKTVVVNSASDLPAPSGGIITLADNTQYAFVNDVNLSDRLVWGTGTIISGSDSNIITLQYTGSSNFITAVDKDVKIKDIKLQCDSGTLFNVSSTTGAHRFRLFNMQLSYMNFGSLSALGLILVDTVNILLQTGTGLTVSGACSVFVVNILSVNGTGTGNFIDLGSATFYSVTIDKVLFTFNSTGYCISGLASSGNINAGGIGTITNILQLGSAAILNGINYYDNLWEMQLNPQINNSIDVMLATHSGATITIGGAGTPVKIGATWTMQQDHRFTAGADGTWTYNGKGAHVEITANISASIATATDNCSFYIYKNGSQIVASRTIRSLTAGTVSNITLIWETELATSDYLELYVANDDAAVNVIISSAKMRIRG